MTGFTTAEKLACVKRELALRERVYPRWVAQDKMTSLKASLETAIMRQIAAEYEETYRKELAEGRLI